MSTYSDYLTNLKKRLYEGIATESTYRPALQDLLESYDKGVSATNEPKRISCGAPDFKVTRKTVLLGYVETKDIGTNLDEMEQGKGPHGGQFIRYRDGLPNWILTDYLEFRWFVKGKKRLTARIGDLHGKDKIAPVKDGEEKLDRLLQAFLSEPALTVTTAKDLATSMAHMTRIVRAQSVESFKMEAEQTEPHLGRPWLHNWLAAFRETLIPDLDEKQFADMFAQTLAYGLFAARVHTPPNKDFSREMAVFSLPKTNPFLRQLFDEIAGINMPDSIAWAVDDIVELLKHADMPEVLKDFGKGKAKEDPVFHFYETFLAEYDPRLRKSRGVYYTPEPVVSYIVHSVNEILKDKFGKPDGLADPSVLVLDPACGTGTFLYAVIKLIYERVKAKGQYGAWSSYVRQSLLPRIFGFELLVAPYAVAHLKLGLLLKETGYDFKAEERLGVYLTNTLDEAAKKSEVLFAQYIADESNSATHIKRDKPIMVVLGNPPYSGISANMNAWIDGLLHGKLPNGTAGGSYYDLDGKPLGERKTWLQDDYVKFIRWGQWRIDKTGSGILAFISNHAYLDNPTFRGMRQQLMKSFSAVNVLDLHGNASRKESCPDGSKDENVFDIRQGVAIGIFVKDASEPVVRHSELWGRRESKYRVLSSSNTDKTKWSNLKPNSPFYFLVPRNEWGREEYASFPSIEEAMPLGITGIITARDGLVVDYSPEPILERMRAMVDPSLSDDEVKSRLSLSENYAWRVSAARRELRKEPVSIGRIKPILYRPFDTRFIYYHPSVVWRTRTDIMSHMMAGRNEGIIYMRQVAQGGDYSHFGVSRDAVDARAFYSNKGIMSFAPLYLYASARQKGQQRLDEIEASPWPKDKGQRVPNLNPEFIAKMEKKVGLNFVPQQPEPCIIPNVARNSRNEDKAADRYIQGDRNHSPFGPEDVFNYMYAIFHSPTYRKRYAEFLKVDFPRIPLTSDKRLFWKFVGLGYELVALHLLESPKVNEFVTKYPKKGTDMVNRVAFSPPQHNRRSADGGRVHINDDQYFEGIEPEWWEFHIGGYQVLKKWLKDRQGRKLSNDDINHYQKIVVALNETIRLMSEIDSIIPSWPVP